VTLTRQTEPQVSCRLGAGLPQVSRRFPNHDSRQNSRFQSQIQLERRFCRFPGGLRSRAGARGRAPAHARDSIPKPAKPAFATEVPSRQWNAANTQKPKPAVNLRETCVEPVGGERPPDASFFPLGGCVLRRLSLSGDQEGQFPWRAGAAFFGKKRSLLRQLAAVLQMP
jgi:hypothetical protein